MHLITGPPTAIDTLIKIQFMQISLVFNLITFTVPGSHRGYTILSHYVPLDLWLSQTFLFWWLWEFQGALVNAFYWSLSDVPLISLEPVGFGEEDCRGEVPFSSLLSRVCTISVTYNLILTGISWLRQFFWLLHCEVIHQPFHTVLC